MGSHADPWEGSETGAEKDSASPAQWLKVKCERPECDI